MPARGASHGTRWAIPRTIPRTTMDFRAGQATMGQSGTVCCAAAGRTYREGAERGAGPRRHLPLALRGVREGPMSRR